GDRGAKARRRIEGPAFRSDQGDVHRRAAADRPAGHPALDADPRIASAGKTPRRDRAHLPGAPEPASGGGEAGDGALGVIRLVGSALVAGPSYGLSINHLSPPSRTLSRERCCFFTHASATGTGVDLNIRPHDGPATSADPTKASRPA